MPCDPKVWDVSKLRSLLCWARENQQHEERIDTRRHDTPTVAECESLFALEDTRV